MKYLPLVIISLFISSAWGTDACHGPSGVLANRPAKNSNHSNMSPDYRDYLASHGIDLRAIDAQIGQDRKNGIARPFYQPLTPAMQKFKEGRTAFYRLYKSRDFNGLGHWDPEVIAAATALSESAEIALREQGYKTKSGPGFLGKSIELLAGPPGTAMARVLDIYHDFFGGRTFVDPSTVPKTLGHSLEEWMFLYPNILLSSPREVNYAFRHEFCHQYSRNLLDGGVRSPYHVRIQLEPSDVTDPKSGYSHEYTLDELLARRAQIESFEATGYTSAEMDPWDVPIEDVTRVYKQLVRTSGILFDRPGIEIEPYVYEPRSNWKPYARVQVSARYKGKEFGTAYISLADVSPSASKSEKIAAFWELFPEIKAVVLDNAAFVKTHLREERRTEPFNPFAIWNSLFFDHR